MRAWGNWLDPIDLKSIALCIPVRVRGNRIEVERFADALVNEKRYMDFIKKYGLDDPMTYQQKARLDVAIKRFEREAGINWPIRSN